MHILDSSGIRIILGETGRGMLEEPLTPFHSSFFSYPEGNV